MTRISETIQIDIDEALQDFNIHRVYPKIAGATYLETIEEAQLMIKELNKFIEIKKKNQ